MYLGYYYNYYFVVDINNIKYNIQLYGGGAILERITVALAQTRLRFNQPYILLSTMDFGQHMEVASLEATEEVMAEASSPKPHRTIGTHTNPRSEHLGSLAWCFLNLVAWAPAMADTHLMLQFNSWEVIIS